MYIHTRGRSSRRASVTSLCVYLLASTFRREYMKSVFMFE